LRDDRQCVREAKEFLAIAVQTGRMIAIDRWVIEHAISVLIEQRSQSRHLHFFVNVAEETLRDEHFLGWMGERLARQPIPPEWLILQVMEEYALTNPSIYARLTRELSALGCRVAINRFGFSQKPERLFNSLRVDFIKLDAQLISGIADDDPKFKRLQKLAEVIRDQGSISIATNIEDARTLSFLWTAGIDYVQGNFLQRPAPTLDLIQ